MKKTLLAIGMIMIKDSNVSGAVPKRKFIVGLKVISVCNIMVVAIPNHIYLFVKIFLNT